MGALMLNYRSFNQNRAKKKKSFTLLGSNWNNSSNTGSFYWNLNNATSNRNRNIGSHLVNAKI